MNSIHQPHDKLFKKSFGKKVVARDFLLNRLPKEVLAQIDMDTLERQNTSFISEAMKAFYSDIVYRVSMKHADIHSYLYLLMEDQKQPQQFMPLRLLEYNVGIMRFDVEQQIKGTKDPTNIKLPSIMNFVLYSGETEWKHATSIIDAFANPDLARMMFERDFLLPLRKQTQESILQDGKAGLAELILAQSRGTDFCDLLSKDPKLMEMINDSLYGQTSILYIMEQDPHSVEEILEKLTKLDPCIKDNVMTALQQLRYESEQKGMELGLIKGNKEGIKQGKQEGIKQGRQEGERTGVRKIAKQMLADGFELQTIARITKLTTQEIITLA